MRIERFEDLRVYQDSFEATMRIFEASKEWPESEKYSLTDQVRHSSRSVCANISEAWFKRSYSKYFASKLNDSISEAAETVTWLRFADRCGYMQSDAAQSPQEEYRKIIGGLVKVITQSEKWCDNNRLREPPAPYEPD